MTREEMLIGWLCIFRYQMDGENELYFSIPDGVEKELVMRGWCESIPDQDWRGTEGLKITDAGCAVSDLSAADWGIELILEPGT